MTAIVALLAFGAAPFTADAADHFLVIGGGHSQLNTQVSLEKNVLFFRDAMATLGLAAEPQQVLFGDGNGIDDDVQFTPANDDQVPLVMRRLGEIYNAESADATQYRPHAIPDVWGPAQREAIQRWFDTVGKTIPDGDRLILYYTGHGGPGNPPRNTTMAMWEEPDLTVKMLVKMLDRLSPKVSVVLIMVQCFSGGFADVIFNDADPTRGLSKQNRCGFFATTSDRSAAGCTPDINLEDYREYSTYFWAALCGHTRTNKPVEKPDYLPDGRISFSEAHAYTLIHSETIDIPVKTSDTFLRQYSQMDAARNDQLMSPSAPYDKLCAAADPSQRAVLDGVSAALKLSQSNRLSEAQRLADSLNQQRADLQQRKRRVDSSIRTLRDMVQSVLVAHFPEMNNPSSATAQKFISTQSYRVNSLMISSLIFEILFVVIFLLV
jgi:hypothetical protein